MIKQREGYKVIILEPAKTWIEQDKCGGCGKEKSEWTRRTDWTNCSKECTSKFRKNYLYLGWQDVRKRVFERDKFSCKSCGFVARDIREKRMYDGKEYNFVIENISSQLDADHILPIALGGDEWDFENIQTLCKGCHKAKTRRDIKKISVERRIPSNQMRIGEALI